MQNNHYQAKHLRGSSPHQEMKQGFESWVRNLRSIEDSPKGQLTPSPDLAQQGNRTAELSAQQSDSPPRSPDGDRWYDDGGEGG